MKTVLIAMFAGTIAFASVQPIAEASAATYNEQVLYSFCAQQQCTDGRYPNGLTAVNGTLYGTTAHGGDGFCRQFPGCGTVFSFDPGTQTTRVLYSFCRHGNLTDCADGLNPVSGLTNVKGLLYGTAKEGGGGTGCGGFGCGTVFSFDPATGVLKVLYAFAGGTDGALPVAGLVEVNGLLYGTTEQGGNTGCYGDGCGTVFSLDPATGAEKVLYTFCQKTNCADGWWPTAGLVAMNGNLYGTTPGGGSSSSNCSQPLGCGTAFSLDPSTGKERVLYSFCSQQDCVDGDGPEAGLIELNGILYGTTFQGGKTGCSSGCGTVFSLDPGTGTETVLRAFSGETDGQWPIAGVIAVKGKLYGTTYFGGAGVGGTVFSLDVNTGRENVLYAFCSQAHCADGANPEASPIVVNGTLYGITGEGGAHCQDNGGCGTLFALEKTR